MKTNFYLPLVLGLFLLGACADQSAQVQDETPDKSEMPADAGAEKSWPPANKEAAPVLEDTLTKKNYYVILDNSGSMNERACQGNGSKMENAKTAMREFVSSVPQNANLGLMNFYGEKVQLGSGDQNRQAVLKEINAAEPRTGTPLHQAIKDAYTKLTAQGRKQLGYGEYYLVIVTDGEYTDSNPAKTVNRIVSESPIVVYTIGFCIGNQHSLNQPGRTEYKEANDLASLKSGLKDVLAESEKFDVSSFK